jgi:hypothetical protein
MNIRFAEWMEKDDRCLYLCATKLRDDVDSNRKKDVTESETIILKDFLSNYLVVRLTNMFFLDVSSPVLTLINHFESEEPSIYKRWDVMSEFFYDMLAKFIKNAGGENVPITDILRIDFADRKLHYSNKEIYLGSKVETFLKELGLCRDSTEIQSWLENVRAFYIEALQKIVKYFKPSLTSRTLQDMDILNPKSLFMYSLDEMKKKYAYVAKRFPNVIKNKQIPDLLDQVARMKFHKKVREATLELTPVEFFFELSKVKDDKFNLVARLGLALLTPHNSSSNAERDISTMVSMVLYCMDSFMYGFI